MSTPLTLCITGGAGFIGSHLADAFLADGHRVIVIDDLSTGRRDNLPASGIAFHPLDIRSREAAEVVRSSGIDVLIHQAAQMDVRRSVDNPHFDADVNVLGSLNLLEAARQGGVKRVLFASTGGAIYGEQNRFPAGENHALRPLSPYGVAKLAVERYLYVYHQTYGLDAISLRYANVYGARQNPHGEAGVIAIFLDRLLNGESPRINGDGLQTRDYVHVADVVTANRAALNRTGHHVYNVGTGRETSVMQLCESLRQGLGGTVPEPIFGPGKAGEQRRSCVDPRRGQRDLQLPDPLDLTDGLARTIDWFRTRHEAEATQPAPFPRTGAHDHGSAR
ncbi:MAG: NAD-dependent epimerase/dehydratase family protein [Acidobacteriota bacterium]